MSVKPSPQCYLLDTCTFIWLLFAPEKLSSKAQQLILDSDTQLLLSSISVLELAILQSIGRETGFKTLRTELPQAREAAAVELLPHDEAAALTLAYLPLAHRDPFDRALIAQAISIGVPIITPDQKFDQYPVQLVW